MYPGINNKALLWILDPGSRAKKALGRDDSWKAVHVTGAHDE